MPAPRSPRARLGRWLVTALVAALAATGGPVTPALAAAPAPVTARLAPAVPNAAAAPQGPVTGSGCTATAAASSCELWATAGSLPLPGAAAPVPIWGFAATATGPAVTPGPVLVVTAGRPVTVTVHNGLSRPLSLAFPGITGMPSDLVGAVPGGATSYTFTPDRPGTYLYEAGHTADGARQAAMGLTGALVVRPAAPGTAYGTADSAFQDEAVLVLSEVDPALNTSADPLVFDLRKFHPVYRLIGGKAYPETQRIATDVGRRVLLRYVNAGLQSHSMSLLGVEQILLASDARPKTISHAVAAESIPPGATLDTLVTMPSGPDGSAYPLYEAASQLNNDNQRYGSTVPAGQTQPQAFGGMLTFLDTNAAPPSGDVVGPVAAHVTAAPATATALDPVTVTADFSDARNGNSPVQRAELVVDSLSVAEGTGTAFTTGAFGAPTVTGASGVITMTALQGLASGRHTVYVRAQDAAGNWGPVGSTTFVLSATGPVTTGAVAAPNPTDGTADVALSATGNDTAFNGSVDGAEYFLDAPGAAGTGTALTLNQTATVVGETGTIPATTMSALAEGHHSVLVRSHDTLGLWGPLATVDLVVDRTAPTLLSGVVAPNPANGSAGSAVDPTALEVAAAFTDTVSGGASSPIAGAEGFLDTAGSTGSGFVFVARDGRFDSAAESTYGLIPLSELTALADGTHHVLVHARDAAGNWGPLTGVDFVVDKGGPTVGGLAAAPNPAAPGGTLTLTGTGTDALSAVTAAEWFEGTDPGAGAGHPMTVTATGARTATLTGTVSLAGATAGSHTYRVRARDAAGNWGPAGTVTATVSASAAIFSDGFEAAALVPPWSARTGTVASTTAARLTGARGLQVTNGTAYVTDTRPAAERSYHATFQFNRNTLASTAGVGMFTALTGTNQVAAVVEYRTSGTARQVRLGVRRSGAIAYSAWSTLPAGTVTIALDWTSATAGAGTLRVNGTQVGSVTGNTSAVTIETVRLGTAAAATGVAYFDAFTSTR